MASKIEIKNITKTYKDIHALDDISIDLDLGKITGVLGPNGSGKTSLLKALAGLIRLDSGYIEIDGKKIKAIDKNKIAYLADEKFLFDYQSIAEIGKMYEEFFPGFNKEYFEQIINFFQLKPKNKIVNLSKGDYKKLGLCLNLSRDASIYIFDEPIDGLDSIAVAKVIDLVIDKVSQGKTFVISTHQISNIENLFDDVIFLKNGKLHEFGQAKAIRDEYGMDLCDFYDEIYLG